MNIKCQVDSSQPSGSRACVNLLPSRPRLVGKRDAVGQSGMARQAASGLAEAVATHASDES